MSNARDDAPKQDGTPLGPIDRRTFLSTSALLGLGLVAGCTPDGRSLGPLAVDPSLLQATPDGTATALQMYERSRAANRLGAWLGEHNLTIERERALLFELGPVSTSGVTAEDRPSLIGETAYKTFQNDQFATSSFTNDQLGSLSSVSRVEMAQDIGSLIQYGGAVLAASCCCCCCCCSICCCSCNGGDNGGSSKLAFQAAAIPFGDPSVVYAGPVVQYYRGMLSVQENGESIAVLEAVANTEEMTVHHITIGALDQDTERVRTYSFTPAELANFGPRELADRLFAQAA